MKKFCLMFVFLLSACGFQPMYGTHSGGGSVQTDIARTSQASLDRIGIDIIPDAEGVYLRNELIDRFYRNGYPAEKAYRLSIQPLQETKKDFDITVDLEATRRQLTLKTVMRLIDTASGKELLRRNVKAISSYDVIGSQFTTRVARQDAREAALNDIARQIELQLTLFFNR